MNEPKLGAEEEMMYLVGELVQDRLCSAAVTGRSQILAA